MLLLLAWRHDGGPIATDELKSTRDHESVKRKKKHNGIPILVLWFWKHQLLLVVIITERSIACCCHCFNRQDDLALLLNVSCSKPFLLNDGYLRFGRRRCQMTWFWRWRRKGCSEKMEVWCAMVRRFWRWCRKGCSKKGSLMRDNPMVLMVV